MNAESGLCERVETPMLINGLQGTVANFWVAQVSRLDERV
jgi:hypothetical protein